jgi:hypothetical protein
MLLLAEFIYNNSIYTSLKISSFKILYSFNPEIATRSSNNRVARGEL